VARETLTRGQLGRATLARQMLLEREDVPVVEAVERLAGMQAQEPKPPFLGLWSRVEGFRAEHLIEALNARELVRATLMRATLHLMSARDYAAVRASLQPGLTAAMTGALRGRDDGLDLDEVLPAARKLLEQRPREFNELRALLQEELPAVNDRALGYAVRTNLPLVMVPTGDRWGFGRSTEITLADGWLEQPLSADRSPQELVRRHLAAFGPASAADVQTWAGLTGLKDVLAAMRDELAVFTEEGGGRRELFDLHDAPRPAEDVPAPPRFLPEFDNLVLAHADRSRLLADEHRGRITTKNLRVRATFLWDGMVRGTWSAERKRGAAKLVVAPFEQLPRGAREGLREEGEALLRFVEPDADSFAVEFEAGRL
jgi:hypothetical protein